jgi:hypothetical protein
MINRKADQAFLMDRIDHKPQFTHVNPDSDKLVLEHPYRKGVMVPQKSKHGFIIGQKQPKPHVCNRPHMFVLFWMWLKGTPCREGTLWRCKCNRVYKRDAKYTVAPVHVLWDPVDDQLWIEAGGEK